MKNLTVAFVLSFIIANSYGQQFINFEDSAALQYIYIDTLNYPNNLWQIGSPQKALFNSSYSSPNALITDTKSFYPTNDTSVLYLWHTAHFNPGWWPFLEFKYKMDSDTLNDFGKIEVSPDLGHTWIDVLKVASTMGWDCIIRTDQNNWFPCDSLSLTGTSDGWYKFSLIMFAWDQLFGHNDTLLFRFTFISDHIETNQEGWMIDDILMIDIIENIEEVSNNSTANIFPNPSEKLITIEVTDFTIFDLTITDNSGRVVLSRTRVAGNSTEVNISYLLPGVYYYNLKDRRTNAIAKGKFIKK